MIMNVNIYQIANEVRKRVDDVSRAHSETDQSPSETQSLMIIYKSMGKGINLLHLSSSLSLSRRHPRQTIDFGKDGVKGWGWLIGNAWKIALRCTRMHVSSLFFHEFQMSISFIKSIR